MARLARVVVREERGQPSNQQLAGKCDLSEPRFSRVTQLPPDGAGPRPRSGREQVLRGGDIPIFERSVVQRRLSVHSWSAVALRLPLPAGDRCVSRVTFLRGNDNTSLARV